MESHLDKELQRDIDRIRSKVIEMGGLVENALASSIAALKKRDRQLAYTVIFRDRYIDRLENELDRLCQEFLVKQLPAAGDLGFIYAVIKINNELERVGDYAESVARQTLNIMALEPYPPIEKFIEIANLAMPMFRNAMQAFADRNSELAFATRKMEEKVNNIDRKS